MNGVSLFQPRPGWPASTVVRLERGRQPVATIAPPAPLAALLPQVLARYGLAKEAPPDLGVASPQATKFDLFA